MAIDATSSSVKTDVPEGDDWENEVTYLQIRKEAIKAFNKKYGLNDNDPAENKNLP